MTARDRSLLAVVVAALVVAAAWFLVLAPQREEAAQLSDDIAAQQQSLAQARSDIAAGLAAKRGYGRAYTTVARLGAAVPDDDNVASLLLQVEQAAEASEIDFRELEAGQSSGAPAPAPPATTASAPATQSATATLPPGAAVGEAGFPTMPFSFTFTGDFFRMSDFVGRLERFLIVHDHYLSVGGRFMTIDGIALNAAPEGFPHVQASVTATTYLLPATQVLTAGATAAAPAALDANGSTIPTGPMGVAR
jgi:hypothetical protein